MSSPASEFTLYAKAERELCDAAAPILGDLLRKIEAEFGVYIAEVRVTVQRPGHDGEPVTANCTIVSAQAVQGPGAGASKDAGHTNLPHESTALPQHRNGCNV